MRNRKPENARRPGRVQRRQDLLGVVYDVVSESGIDGASMRQIADRAQVSTGTINYHFGNKEKLVMAALRAAYQTMPPKGGLEISPLEQLKGFAFSYIFRSSQDRFWRFWVNYTAHGTRDREMRDHQNQRFEKQQGHWQKLIQAAIESGELKAGLTAATTSKHLLIFTHGLVVRQLLQPGQKTRTECQGLLEDYFAGIEADKPKA